MGNMLLQARKATWTWATETLALVKWAVISVRHIHYLYLSTEEQFFTRPASVSPRVRASEGWDRPRTKLLPAPRFS